MKNWRLLVTIISCILILTGVGVGIYFAVADTNRNTADEIVYHTVTFEGSDISPMQVADGALVLRPLNTEKERYTFEGFYKDSEYTTEWNFDVDRVYGDTVIYAKYSVKEYGISLDTTDVKTVYNKGEALDTTGLIVRLIKIDLRIYPLSLTDCDITTTRTDANKAGWYEVVVTYKGFSSSYEIEVLPTTEKKVLAYVDDTVYYKNYVSSGTDAETLDIGTPTYSREGYRFGGWCVDKGGNIPFDEDTEITDNTTLYASWIEEFEVNYNGVDIASQYALKNDTYLFSTTGNLEKTGYRYMGVATSKAYHYTDVNGETLDISDEDVSGLTKEFGIENNHYVVTYAEITSVGAQYTKTYKYKKVYDGDIVQAGDTITLSTAHTLYGIYEPKTFRITFTGVEDVASEFKIVTYDGVYGELPKVDTASLKFVSWKLGGADITSDTIVKIISDSTLEAQMSLKVDIQHTARLSINYIYTGAINNDLHTYSNSYYDVNGKYVEEIFFVENQDLVGYLKYDNGVRLSGDSFVYNGVSFTIEGEALKVSGTELDKTNGYYVYQMGSRSKYILVSENEVKIFNYYDDSKYSFDSARGMIVATESYNVYDGFSYDEMLDAFAEQYIFGRFGNATKTRVYAGGEVFARNMGSEFYARWQDFVSRRTNLGYSFYMPSNMEAYVITNDIDNAVYGEIVNLNNDIDLSIKECQAMTVLLNLQGGEIEGNNRIQCAIGYVYPEIPTPTRQGYKFDGWYTDNTYTVKIDDTTTVKRLQTEIVAKWVALRTINVSVYDNIDSDSPTKTIVYHENDTYGTKLPVAETKTGYVFGGWYSDKDLSTQVDADTQVVSQTLYAKYTPIQIIVTLNYGDDIAIGNGIRVYNYNDYYGSLPTVSTEEFASGGWYLDAGLTEQIMGNTKITKSVNHTIYFKKLSIHKVTVLSDVYGASGKKYEYDVAITKSIILPSNTYTRQGYVFDGWFWDVNDNGLYDSEDVDVDPNNSSLYRARTSFYLTVDHDVFVRAKWSRVLTVKYSNGGDQSAGSIADQSLVEGKTITISNLNHTYANYNVADWVYIAPDGQNYTISPRSSAKISEAFLVYIYDQNRERYTLTTLDMKGVFNIGQQQYTYTWDKVYRGTKDVLRNETFKLTDALIYDEDLDAYHDGDYLIYIPNSIVLEPNWLFEVNIVTSYPSATTAKSSTINVPIGRELDLYPYFITSNNATYWTIDSVIVKLHTTVDTIELTPEQYTAYVVQEPCTIYITYKKFVEVKLDSYFDRDDSIVLYLDDNYTEAITAFMDGIDEGFAVRVGNIGFELNGDAPKEDLTHLVSELFSSLPDDNSNTTITLRKETVKHNVITITKLKSLNYEFVNIYGQFSAPSGSIDIYSGSYVNFNNILSAIPNSAYFKIYKLEFVRSDESTIVNTGDPSSLMLSSAEFDCDSVKIYVDKYARLYFDSEVIGRGGYFTLTRSMLDDLLESEDVADDFAELAGLSDTLEGCYNDYAYAMSGYEVGYNYYYATPYSNGLSYQTSQEVLELLATYMDMDWTAHDNVPDINNNQFIINPHYISRSVPITLILRDENGEELYNDEYQIQNVVGLHYEIGPTFYESINSMLDNYVVGDRLSYGGMVLQADKYLYMPNSSYTTFTIDLAESGSTMIIDMAKCLKIDMEISEDGSILASANIFIENSSDEILDNTIDLISEGLENKTFYIYVNDRLYVEVEKDISKDTFDKNEIITVVGVILNDLDGKRVLITNEKYVSVNIETTNGSYMNMRYRSHESQSENLRYWIRELLYGEIYNDYDEVIYISINDQQVAIGNVSQFALSEVIDTIDGVLPKGDSVIKLSLNPFEPEESQQEPQEDPQD